MLVIFPIFYANAGFFGFFDTIFGNGSAQKSKEKQEISQNMALLKAPLNPNTSYSTGGGEITIVNDSALAPEVAYVEGEGTPQYTGSTQISTYVVKEGDSLSQIARMFNVSINTIIWANDLQRSTIRPGQQLVILPVSGVKHTIKSGDTLKSLATKYKADIDEILQYNDLGSNAKLAIGDVIIIPDGEISAVSASSVGSRSTVKYPTYEGYYRRPIDGGRRSQGLHGYNGIDIAAPPGTPIVASASGDVIIARGSGWNGGYGSYIVISHDNGTQTLYSHLSSLAVYGGPVVQGQIIGYVGATGKATGPHLHFEVRGAKNPF